MEEFKKQIKKVFEDLVVLEDKWNNLDDHKTIMVEQVVEETGFNELGNLEEVVWKFKKLYKQIKYVNVINGIQIWINDSGKLCFILYNQEYTIRRLKQIKDFINNDMLESKTANRIINWYLRSG